jgi:hypothetical protein
MMERDIKQEIYSFYFLPNPYSYYQVNEDAIDWVRNVIKQYKLGKTEGQIPLDK